ncbi:MAG: hypothetical protein CMH30_00785 [Micavibrio sp.]|nr:hypothetical protein [Micavibrio sp.]|tara:strand:- start:2862 stop:3686 length:825 start_codon:yes stop_codon:yes gene_type:complete
MKTSILTAVSVLALMAAAPALADNTERTMNQNDTPTITEQDVERNWDKAKDNVKEGWENTKDAVKDTYNKAENAITGENRMAMSELPANELSTAKGILGQPVYNTNGDRVAKVKDIILDRNGNARMVILADGDFTGLGKLAAFDYNVVTQRTAEGDVVASLTEETINQAAEFSYDPEDSSRTVKVKPNDGYSVTELLGSRVINPEGETLATLDNITFNNGRAENMVVSYGGVLGLGAEKAAFDFTDADKTRDGDSIKLQLSADEASDFEAYKRM